jgi:hypothetical protein
VRNMNKASRKVSVQIACLHVELFGLLELNLGPESKALTKHFY